MSTRYTFKSSFQTFFFGPIETKKSLHQKLIQRNAAIFEITKFILPIIIVFFYSIGRLFLKLSKLDSQKEQTWKGLISKKRTHFEGCLRILIFKLTKYYDENQPVSLMRMVSLWK